MHRKHATSEQIPANCVENGNNPAENAPNSLSHRALSEAVLRAIIEDADASPSEKTSAIKELRILTGDDGGQTAGPGAMTRAELQAELRRLQALTGGKALRTKGKALPSKG